MESISKQYCFGLSFDVDKNTSNDLYKKFLDIDWNMLINGSNNFMNQVINENNNCISKIVEFDRKLSERRIQI
jgi:hypothetical protein